LDKSALNHKVEQIPFLQQTNKLHVGKFSPSSSLLSFFVFLHRSDQNTEALSKAHAIEDLHGRLKANVESIQQLNQQVSTRKRNRRRMWQDSEPFISSSVSVEKLCLLSAI